MRPIGYAIGGLGTAIAMLSFAVALEVTTATARPSAEPVALHEVNRALKGDRLVAATRTPTTVQPAAQSLDNRMPDGCETGVSTIVRQTQKRARLCLT